MSYDTNNIFAKILRGEVPCEKIYEDEYVLSFYDVNPQRKIHALVIPKGNYIDLDDFNAKATDKEIVGYFKGISKVAKKLGKERSTELVENSNQSKAVGFINTRKIKTVDDDGNETIREQEDLKLVPEQRRPMLRQVRQR